MQTSELLTTLNAASNLFRDELVARDEEIKQLRLDVNVNHVLVDSLRAEREDLFRRLNESEAKWAEAQTRLDRFTSDDSDHSPNDDDEDAVQPDAPEAEPITAAELRNL